MSGVADVAGVVNWYRNREQNFQDELALTKKIIEVPVLFIQATSDEALPPAMAVGMERWLPRLTRREVGAGHWVLWEKPVEVCGMVGEWLERVDGRGRSRL